MKQFILILAIICTIAACSATKNKVAATDPVTTIAQGSINGKVSHQYRATGCSTVIIIKQSSTPAPLTLIPIDTLSSTFDVDGLEIYFDFRPLKVRNPDGCSVGIPAAISNISKK